jgi:hypothetical protein
MKEVSVLSILKDALEDIEDLQDTEAGRERLAEMIDDQGQEGSRNHLKLVSEEEVVFFGGCG